MNISFYIAKRYLISKKSKNAINIISWISVISVGIGTFALVVVLSAFNGIEGLVESLFESFDSDIKVTLNEGKTFSAEEIDYAQLEQMDGFVNYTKVLEEVCGIRYKKQQTVATIKGVDDSFIQMSELEKNMVEGSTQLQSGNISFAIAGYGVASSLGLFLTKSPDNISIYAPSNKPFNSFNPLESVYLKQIAPGGVFYISPEYDLKYILVPLGFAQKLLNIPRQITGVEIKFQENANLPELKENIQNLLGEKFKVSTRYEFNEIIYKTNKTEKWVTFLILVFILIIASFNILSSLSMLIIDKRKDIHTLKSLGASDGLVRKIFFMEGMLINLSGAVGGLLLGLLVCLAQQHFGLIRLEGGIVDFYPVEVRGLELLAIFFTVLVIGLITSWYPIRSLTKLKD